MKRVKGKTRGVTMPKPSGSEKLWAFMVSLPSTWTYTKKVEFQFFIRQHQLQNRCHFVSSVMHICGAKFQEHCFNISRDIFYSVFYHFQLHSEWHNHWSNMHYNRKTSMSLKKKILQKEKCHSSVFWEAFQISRNYFSCHIHFKLPVFL